MRGRLLQPRRLMPMVKQLPENKRGEFMITESKAREKMLAARTRWREVNQRMRHAFRHGAPAVVAALEAEERRRMQTFRSAVKVLVKAWGRAGALKKKNKKESKK